MGDGGAERSVGRRDRVDVDPLVVAGRLRELIDPVLFDREPVARAEISTDRVEEFVGVGEDRGHVTTLSGSRCRGSRGQDFAQPIASAMTAGSWTAAAPSTRANCRCSAHPMTGVSLRSSTRSTASPNTRTPTGDPFSVDTA